MSNEEQAYRSELKKIGKRVKRFLSEVNSELYDMNANIRLCVSATVAGSLEYSEWPTDALRSEAEEYASEAEELGIIDVDGLDEILVVLYYREREEKEKEKKVKKEAPK